MVRALSAPARGLYRLFGGYRVTGAENIPPSGGCILASNHLSWADPPAIQAAIQRPTWFMANDFLFRIPVLGPLIRYFGAFPVRRGALDREAIRQAEELLKSGEIITIFPEGGTTVTGRLVPLEGGVALLALRAGVPVIPIGIGGTDRVLPRRLTFPRWARGGVTVRIGKPIYPSEIDPSLSRRERMDALTQKLYWSIDALIPEEYRAYPDEPRGIVSSQKPAPEPPARLAAE